jgi:hypothetical protein
MVISQTFFDNGLQSTVCIISVDNVSCLVFSAGIHTGILSGNPQTKYYTGQGMDNTILEKTLTGSNNGPNYFYDMQLNVLPGSYGGNGHYGCVINFNVQNNLAFYNCKIIRNPSTGNFYQCSFIGILASVNIGQGSALFDDCNISVSSQNEVNRSTQHFVAFNNCKFRIGTNETEYTALPGATADELRASFIARCVAAGYTVPSVTEYSQTLQAGRWVFSNNSTVDGLVLKGSEIHLFEIPRLFYFGYSSGRNDMIGITTDKTRPGSFSPAYAVGALDVTAGSIGLKPATDISQKLNLTAGTNIIWLGGKYQVNLIDIIHNLPKEYGVWLDGTLTLAATPTTAIEVRLIT